MTHRLLAILATSALGVFALANAAGCSSTTGVAADGGPGADGGGDAGTCPTLGSGKLDVQISGLPAGVSAKVQLRKADGAESTLTASTVLADTAAGTYSASPVEVVDEDPTVKTVFRAATPAPVCVSSGGTATLSIVYAAIPTSNKLWMTTSNGELGELIAFRSSDLRASGTPAPVTKITSPAGSQIFRSLAFDVDGNLWVNRDGAFARFSAASLAGSGAPVPELVKEVDFGCGPAINHMATDKAGGLWVSSLCAGGFVAHFTKAQLEGPPPLSVATPAIKLKDPNDIAFDASGNLWITTEGKWARFDAASLAGSLTAPNLVIEVQTSAPVFIGLEHLAFDKSGNAWGAGLAGVSVTKVPAAQLVGTGTKTVTIDSANSLGVGALIESLAFDESGGLWLAGSAGKFVRLSPTQLATMSPDIITPEIVMVPAGLGYAEGFAFFPGPAPLASARR